MKGKTMTSMQRLVRYPLCLIGSHVPPVARQPMGPVVADCPCCGKTCYFYGLSAFGFGAPPVLLAAPIRAVVQLPR
jgi:hypothetical protein